MDEQSAAPAHDSVLPVPPGWYTEPGTDFIRYHDGTSWTTERRWASYPPQGPSQPAVPPTSTGEGQKAEPVHCTECGVEVATPAGLKTHIASMHDQARPATDDSYQAGPVRCPECGVEVATPAGLKTHIASMHGGAATAATPRPASPQGPARPPTRRSSGGTRSPAKAVGAILILAILIGGYVHISSDDFRLKCTLSKLGASTLSLPDKLLCDAFYTWRKD